MNAKITRMIGLTAVCLAFMVLVIVNQARATPVTPVGLQPWLYLPVIMRPPVQDLTVTAVEINQSVQRANNSVPLVANRNTIVRVYAEAPADGPVSGVVVRLSAIRNGVPLGHIDSALVTVPIDATRDNEDSSVNFQLPAGWLYGNVNLTATVDPANTIAEPDESNNSIAATMTFNNVPALQVVIVPINYTHTGPTNPGYYPAQSVDYISDWIMRAYPISTMNVTIRTPYNFTGNLQDGFYWHNSGDTGLLDRMFPLKLADGYPQDTPVVYYAFVPISNGSSRWFFSGIAGIGWIGYRESVGLNLTGFFSVDATGTLAGHEIGHNLGRYHAPCGNPGGPDPSFPYAGASIGEYGIDIPRGIFWTPATAVDVMSYCSPEWVSDYTYIGLYNDQMNNGFALAQTAVQSMIVTAGLDTDGSVTLHPTYAFSSYPSTAVASDYQVELLDEAGNVLLAQPMKLREAEEEGVSGRMLTAVLPLPTKPVTAVRVMQGEQIIATRTLNNAAAFGRQMVTATRADNSVTLSWGLVGTPAIVRYSPDGGQSWITLSIGITDGTFTLDTTTLPEGDNGIFEIIPADTGSTAVLTTTMP